VELFCAATVCSGPLVVFLHDDPLGFGVIGGEERHWQGRPHSKGRMAVVGVRGRKGETLARCRPHSKGRMAIGRTGWDWSS